MKIANDIFLWSVGNFLEKLDEPKLAKKVFKKMEHEIEIKKNYAKEFDLYKILKKYFKENEELKEYLEKLTKKIAEIDEEEHSEKENEKEKENGHQKKSKRKNTEESVKETKKSKKKNEEESDEEQEKPKKDKKEKEKSRKASKAKKEEEDDESDFDIDPKKIREKLGLNINYTKTANTPFRRIKEEDYEIKDKKLACNSWESYAQLSGNRFGEEANNKLKVTRGADFKKEKNKFKNKSGMGGGELMTNSLSIKFQDSDSD